jgi:hypothetical protein
MTPLRTLSRRGVTATQLILVLALLLLALAFLAPAVARIRLAAARTHSLNNLKQLGLATHNYIDTFRKIPPAVGPFDPNEPEKVGTAHYYLLPYLEQDPLFQKGGGLKGSSWQGDVAATPLPVFIDPQDTSAPPGNVYKGWLATTSYACNWLVFKDGSNRFPQAIPDGTSNTLMFAQRYQMCDGTPTAWGYAALYYWAPMFAYYGTEKFQPAPAAHDCDPTLAQAIGSPYILTAFCDGSARTIRPQIRSETWFLLACPDDGQPIAEDF